MIKEEGGQGTRVESTALQIVIYYTNTFWNWNTIVSIPISLREYRSVEVWKRNDEKRVLLHIWYAIKWIKCFISKVSLLYYFILNNKSYHSLISVSEIISPVIVYYKKHSTWPKFPSYFISHPSQDLCFRFETYQNPPPAKKGAVTSFRSAFKVSRSV